MSSTTRTFVAVEVPAALTTRLARLQQQFAAEVPEARWAVPQPFHVTVSFVGDVDNADLHDLCRAVSAAVAPVGRFSLSLKGLGAFPSPERPKTAWLDVVEVEPDALHILHATVDDAVRAMRYPVDHRPYHPHVTLGRFPHGNKREPRDLNPLFSHFRSWRGGPFLVNEVVVFSSIPGRDGPEYAPLVRAPLGSRKPATSP